MKTTLTRGVWEKTAERRAADSTHDATTQDARAADRSPGALAPALLDFQSHAWRQSAAALVTSDAGKRLLATADELLAGRASLLGFTRNDMIRPDWDLRPLAVYPAGFDTSPGGSDKLYWETSRGNVLTQLASASLLSGDSRYARRGGDLLSQWCNHFAAPSGPMWESGVELGIRMQSWTWLRRLGALQIGAVFETDAVTNAIANHLEILLRFPSSHSSANNHRLVEAAGLLTGGCCFSDLVDAQLASKARTRGLAILSNELSLQVSAAGLHREQAVDYHCFVLEVAFFALLEAELHGLQVPPHTWIAVHRMTDALDAICDGSASGPRFGDTDNSHVVQLDATFDRPTLRALALMGAVTGGPAARRGLPVDVRSAVVKTVVDTYLAKAHTGINRPSSRLTDRISLAREGTVVTTRTASERGDQVWLSLRSGPLGYLPIAAHAHADLNAIELRIGTVPFLIDPGTFLYGEDLPLRRMFRDTANHNTITVDNEPQARYAGPFLWGSDALGVVEISSMISSGAVSARAVSTRAVSTGVVSTDVTSATVQSGPRYEGVQPPEVGDFRSTHDGYARSRNGPGHRRAVSFSGDGLTLTDTLVVLGSTVADHANPAAGIDFNALIDGQWSVSLDGVQLTAVHPEWTVHMELDPALQWRLIAASSTGEGWQAPSYGHLTPATAVRGSGTLPYETPLTTRIAWKRREP